MPRKKDANTAHDPVLYLKSLALRDDPLVHRYRDVHYQLVIDSLQATGQAIASGEYVAALSDASRRRLLKRHASLSETIRKKYFVKEFEGGDPYLVKKSDWLLTLKAKSGDRLRVDTNWKTSFSPRVQFLLIPQGAQAFPAENGTLYQLPPMPKRPVASPPIMTLHLDLSQVKPNSLAELANEFKQEISRCLKSLPKKLRKPPATWQQNVERDYRRFGQHFYQGVPFRWIAAYERMGAMPKRRIGTPVPTESSVRESVERVHLILFRKELRVFSESFKARKHVSHSADARLAHKIKSFDCPDHGQACGSSCQYAKNFYSDIKDLR
jgi:hypothetical protein